MSWLKYVFSPLSLMSLYTFWGGGGDAPQSTTTVQQNYSPEVAAAQTQLMNEAKRIYESQLGQWSSFFPQAAPVGMTLSTKQGRDMIESAAIGPGSNIAASGANAVNFGLSGAALNPSSVPGFEGALNAAIRPVTNAFTDPGGVLSQIRTGFTAGNSGGTGTREGIASGIAGREYLNTIGDISSKMALEQYGQGLDFMKSSMAFAPSMFNLQLQPGQILTALGAQKEAYSQQQADYEAAKKAWELQAPWAALSPYASLTTGFPATGTTSTGIGSAPQGPGAMGILGGAAMGAYLGSVVPGIGTVVGAGLGAALPILMGI